MDADTERSARRSMRSVQLPEPFFASRVAQTPSGGAGQAANFAREFVGDSRRKPVPRLPWQLKQLETVGVPVPLCDRGLAGKKSASRKGSMPRRSMRCMFCAASFMLPDSSTAGTTSPRVRSLAPLSGRAFRFNNANVIPSALAAIHVPPPISRGYTASSVPAPVRLGSSASGRVRRSSRFIPIR